MTTRGKEMEVEEESKRSRLRSFVFLDLNLLSSTPLLIPFPVLYFHFHFPFTILFIPYAVSNHEWWENEKEKNGKEMGCGSLINTTATAHSFQALIINFGSLRQRDEC